MHQYDPCIREAKSTLGVTDDNKDEMALFWISLSYLNLSYLEEENSSQKSAMVELAKLFGALSLYCSFEKETDGRLSTLFSRNKLLQQFKDIIVIEMGMAGNLKEMIRQQNIANMKTKGRKVVLYVKPGTYDFPIGPIGNMTITYKLTFKH